jgi:hypothetical protein
MNQRVGTCDNCGGDVMGYRGAWMGVVPPPPDQCSSCGAVRADDIIKMTKTSKQDSYFGKIRYKTSDNTSS